MAHYRQLLISETAIAFQAVRSISSLFSVYFLFSVQIKLNIGYLKASPHISLNNAEGIS